MSSITRPHITICICTYKRLVYLDQLLHKLEDQETNGCFSYSIVVTDNDSRQSAKSLVLDFEKRSGVPVIYCVEPRQNISRARNRAIEHANGEFIAFIDDDEYPTLDWLITLFRACEKYKVDGVLGPVLPAYETKPPSWVVKGRFYERPAYPTGFVIDWRKGRTGNVLLRRDLFLEETPPFRPDLLTGEDQDFFRRMIDKGHSFVWCNEAVAYEMVPATRWKRTFMLRRALLRGKISLRHPRSRFLQIAKSSLAIPIYALALPFMLLLGQGVFMKYLVKVFDHAGRLLAVMGIDVAGEHYVTE